MIDAPSILRLTRKSAVLTRGLPTLLLNIGRNTVCRNVKSPLLVDCSDCTLNYCCLFVYYESLKRELKTKPIYEFRCDERLKTKVEESTRLACTLLVAELEHLKIETRLIDEMFASEMGEYVFFYVIGVSSTLRSMGGHWELFLCLNCCLLLKRELIPLLNQNINVVPQKLV